MARMEENDDLLVALRAALEILPEDEIVESIEADSGYRDFSEYDTTGRGEIDVRPSGFVDVKVKTYSEERRKGPKGPVTLKTYQLVCPGGQSSGQWNLVLLEERYLCCPEIP